MNETVKSLSAKLAAGSVSAVELAQDYLTRIRAVNPVLNAFVELNEERTLADARAADALRAEGRAGVLTGVPIAHKDIFCQTGWHARCGSKMLESFAAPYDATLIARSRDAGLVTLGRTNMDEFAMGSSNESSHYGAVRNPWQHDAVPGGSSGGSAAAVAAGLAPAASGTDTGGSIRQPAAFCGITGIKPTYGIVSRWGMIAYASSLDQGGPMAHTAEDCALLLNAFAGFDERDSTSLQRPAEDYTRLLAAPLAGLRIGVPKEFFGEGMSDDVRTAVEAALATFRTLGASTVEVSLPRAGYAVPAYYVIAPAEASSNLSRFDGVRYGYRAPEYGDLADMYAKTRAQGFGEEVKRRILIGTYVLSHGYYDAYYLQAQKVRRLIADDYAAAFTQCDLIIGPTTPTVAYGLGEKTDDPLSMYLGDIYTTSINLAGLPGMSIPCGFGAGGLPVGLQIVGNYFSEARMLGAAHQFQQATDWHLRRPKE
ncbi:MAG TPA: Asp-tRNA(Asn)/Glu-tRNA(Gln) amidotransferase subunit GatA [Methyloversatilis sp.]